MTEPKFWKKKVLKELTYDLAVWYRNMYIVLQTQSNPNYSFEKIPVDGYYHKDNTIDHENSNK